jgi:hypothetical protein
MRLPRRLTRRRKARDEAPPESTSEAGAVPRDRAEAMAEGARRRRPAPWIEAVSVRLRGAAFELRRRLRPLVHGLSRVVSGVAPRVSRVIFVVAGLPVALVAAGLDLFLRTVAATRERLAPVAAFASTLAARVTPIRVLVAVLLLTAAALAGSQFTDYRGVAVGDPQYPANVARVAPPPLADIEHAGEAHLYLGVPAAILVVVLTWLTARGRWQLGRAIALVGVAGIALTLLVDRPQGLDAGSAGVAYLGTEAKLLEGFWGQLAACVGLVICGPLLGWHVKLAVAEGERRRRRGTGGLGRLRPAQARRAAVEARA